MVFFGRFHVLQEFDDGKRSCRRRLAGHNKRRRKRNPEVVVNDKSLNDEQTSGYLLLSLLKILSNLHCKYLVDFPLQPNAIGFLSIEYITFYIFSLKNESKLLYVFILTQSFSLLGT